MIGIEGNRKRERERVGVGCPGLGKAEEGSPGWCSGTGCLMYLMDRQLHLIIVQVANSVVAFS